jgi:hypothetical protein
VDVGIEVNDRATALALRSARRETNAGIREGLKAGVSRHGLPLAKRLSPGGHVAQHLSAGATTRSAYLQMRVIRGDEALHEFGGVRRDIIEPGEGHQAVMTPAGPRRRVKGARRYKARRFMQLAVLKTLDEVTEEAAKAIGEVFQRAGLDVDE